MVITKMALPRRTVLRTMGATIALPLLDAMVPALTPVVKTAAAPIPRAGFIYVPNGQAQVNFFPKQAGPNFEFPKTLLPLEGFRDRLVVISGLSNLEAESKDLGTGPHTRGACVWITGVRPKRTEGADVQVGQSLDQYAADVLGANTQLRSLEVAIESNYNQGNCDNGYSCLYLNTFSWKTATVPMPMEHNPRVIFERLFGAGETAAERAAQMKQRKSILDGLNSEMAALQRSLGADDRATVTEYLEAVRDVERRIQKAEQQHADSEVPITPPTGMPDNHEEAVKLMYDLMVFAWQADVTRVASFQIAREQSGQTYPWIGVPEADHETSHHGPDPEKTARRTKVNVYHAQLLAYFLEKLRQTKDGDGTLLDHVAVLYGSGLGDGNVHSTHNLPVLIAGGACGQLKGNRYIAYPLDTPMMNMGLSLLHKVGVHCDRVGDSTGELTDL
jgi:hypothetical protein